MVMTPIWCFRGASVNVEEQGESKSPGPASPAACLLSLRFGPELASRRTQASHSL